MGADTANHYQWFPWHNNGHYELWRAGGDAERARAIGYYRDGLERVVAARQQRVPRRHSVHLVLEQPHGRRSPRRRACIGEMTRRRPFPSSTSMAAIDWLFGANPWGDVDGHRLPERRRLSARPSLGRGEGLERRAHGRADRRSRVPLDLPESARDSAHSSPTSSRHSTSATLSITMIWATTPPTSRSWMAPRT